MSNDKYYPVGYWKWVVVRIIPFGNKLAGDYEKCVQSL